MRVEQVIHGIHKIIHGFNDHNRKANRLLRLATKLVIVETTCNHVDVAKTIACLFSHIGAYSNNENKHANTDCKDNDTQI